MTVADKIRQALKNMYGEGAANAYQIYKGYAMSTGRTGWHIIPFGGNAQCIGDNEREALSHLDAVAEIHAEQARHALEWPPIA